MVASPAECLEQRLELVELNGRKPDAVATTIVSILLAAQHT